MPDSGVGFELTHSDGRRSLCQFVIVATGLSVPHKPFKDQQGLVESYDTISTDADDFEGQEVLIIGRGNAALETANHIYGHTARVHLVSSSRVKLSCARLSSNAPWNFFVALLIFAIGTHRGNALPGKCPRCEQRNLG